MNTHQCARIGCQEPATCTHEVWIGIKKVTAHLCRKHDEEVMAYAERMRALTGWPRISTIEYVDEVQTWP